MKVLYRKLIYVTPTIIFNALELLMLLGVGALLRIPIWQPAAILVLFMLVRNLVGKGKHYRNPLLCLIWSCVVFSALFVVAKICFPLAAVLTVFYATAQTGRVDVREVFMWKGSDTDYKYIQKFVEKMNGSEALQVFEDKLKFVNDKVYKIYDYRFKKHYSFSTISNMMQIDTRRISEMLKILDTTINVYFNIK